MKMKMSSFTNGSNSSPVAILNPTVYIRYQTNLTIFLVIILIVNVLGSIANGVLFATTLTYQPLRKSSTCALMAHCIIIDLFMTICAQPGLALATYLGPAVLALNFCRVWGAVMFGLSYANNWAHSMLAINRFLAAVFPYGYRNVTTRPAVFLAVTLPWLISILLNAFPTAEISMRYAVMKPWSGCVPDAYPGVVYKPQRALSFVGVYIPCVIIGFSYSVVLIKAKLDVRGTRRVGDVDSPPVLGKRYTISKMLFICFLWHCVSNFAIPIALSSSPELYAASPLTQLAFKGLQCVSSAVNPVFFVVVSGTYRSGVVAVVKCERGRRSSLTNKASTRPGRDIQNDGSRPSVGTRSRHAAVSA